MMRVCDECQLQYDPTSRGAWGPFHLCVVASDVAEDSTIHVVGHWRSGIWHAEEPLKLIRRDGFAVAIPRAEIGVPSNPVVAARGQASLRLYGVSAAQWQGGGCIWSAGAWN